MQRKIDNWQNKVIFIFVNRGEKEKIKRKIEK